MLGETGSFVLTPSLPERGLSVDLLPIVSAGEDEDDDTSLSLKPSLSLELGAGPNRDVILSDASVPLLPSCNVEDELIRELLPSLTLSLPERRLEEVEVEVEEEEEERVLLWVTGLVILMVDGDTKVEEEEEAPTLDTIVRSLDVSSVTRVDGFEMLAARWMLVVVDGFCWSSREKTEDNGA